MKESFYKLGLRIKKTNHLGQEYLTPFGRFISLLLRGMQKDGFMSSTQQNKYFSSRNKGLLLDGNKRRLTQKDSFNHLALISRTGGGKTTSFVIPNIFKLAEDNNSIVITDISGELYEKTSGYLSQKGYKIYVLNPEKLDESIGYNPLYYCKDSASIDELVTILIRSNKEKVDTSGKNEYWESGAKSIISLLIKLLLLRGNPKHINLANVKYLLNSYGSDGKDLQPLFDELDDEKVKDEFNALTKINTNTLTSIIATANVALNPIGINDNLELLTANHTIDINKFRKEKSVIYIKIPGHKQKQYRFLLNIFYTQFFNHMQSTLPTKNNLPIYCLLDEFGNMNLPNFDTTITTIRKYQISISIILQDLMQLETTYGKSQAEIIINGGISSKLFFSGASLPTTEMLSDILGYVKNHSLEQNGKFQEKIEKVMRSDEIRIMKDDEALFIMANLIPVKLKITPYYKDFIYNQFSKIPSYKNQNEHKFNNLDFIDLHGI